MAFSIIALCLVIAFLIGAYWFVKKDLEDGFND